MIVTTVNWFVDETSPQMVKYGWELLVPDDKNLWSCYWSGYSFSLTIRGLCTCGDVRQPAEKTAVAWGRARLWRFDQILPSCLLGKHLLFWRASAGQKDAKRRDQKHFCAADLIWSLKVHVSIWGRGGRESLRRHMIRLAFDKSSLCSPVRRLVFSIMHQLMFSFFPFNLWMQCRVTLGLWYFKFTGPF